MSLPRLQPAILARLPAAVVRPAFDRTRLRVGIVHIGLGAFARAFLAPATDDAIARSGELDWGIIGVSLKRRDTAEALAPQAGLSTVMCRTSGGTELRVVGSVLDVLFAPEHWDTIVQRIAAPDTRIITLTITEKGYDDNGPGSAIRLVADGLARRFAAGVRPISILSLDNITRNGERIRHEILRTVDSASPALTQWIATACCWPNTMVDRIVPRTTPADRIAVASMLGYEDAWPVVAEPYMEWCIEDRFAAGRPDWAAGGARMVAAIVPEEARKLRMVNGAHSSIVYAALLAGWESVDEALSQASMRDHINALLRDEVEPTLLGVELADYRARLLDRFANPGLRHTCAQIAQDGSRKIPLRLLATIRDRRRAGYPIPRLAFGVAAWLAWWPNVQDADDPMAGSLRATATRAAGANDVVRRTRLLVRSVDCFGELATDEQFVAPVAAALDAIECHGVMVALGQPMS